MAINGYHIISLEANDLYKRELDNGVENGYKLPKKNSYAYFKLFKNILD